MNNSSTDDATRNIKPMNWCDRPSNQWIDVTDMDTVVVQKRGAHQQHEDAESQQKTDEHENDWEIYVGINLLHD